MGASHVPWIIDRACSLFKDPRFLEIVNEGHTKEEWRRGGYLYIREDREGLPRPLAVLLRVGLIPEDWVDRYRYNAREKGERLLFFPSHVSSSESRDPDNGKYSGAVRFDGLITSLSGLWENADHASALAFRTRPHQSPAQCEALRAIAAKVDGGLAMYEKILALR